MKALDFIQKIICVIEYGDCMALIVALELFNRKSHS